MNAIADIQSYQDTRNQPINRVGIKKLKLPIQIQTAAGIQATIADFSMSVFLPPEQKGTHMSRFIDILNQHNQPISQKNLPELTEKMLATLNSNAGEIQIETTYFRMKAAPVSGIKSLMDYQFTLIGMIENSRYHHILQLVIPVTSLCPCSKEISAYGAHNQRSHVTVRIESNDIVEPEELIDLVESQASCQVYGLLKRPDEKYVTEHAYDNPKFVEDMVRDIAVRLKQEQRISRFTLESENFESIHNHSAYAIISYP